MPAKPKKSAAAAAKTSSNTTPATQDDAPAWVAQAQAALALLDPSESQHHKKKATLMALAWAKFAGETKQSVFARPETCSAVIYYTKWAVDPTFAEAERKLLELVSAALTDEEVLVMARATRKLRLASEQAVDELIKLLKARSEFARLQTAQTILDRASAETAVKGGAGELGSVTFTNIVAALQQAQAQVVSATDGQQKETTAESPE
jgi:hypothetical protein